MKTIPATQTGIELIRRYTIEMALDAGCLSVRATNGNLYKARRNGMTKTWQTRPSNFRIPITFSFKSHTVIDQDNVMNDAFVITPALLVVR